MKTLPPLGDITVEQFLSKYWQQKPLVIRKALPDFVCPVTPEELAGLAMEDEVESRLILERDGATPWELKSGPFTEEAFTSLPASHWRLEVAEANQHIPALALLQERFAFLPNWRLDAVMVSFAPEHGTVGPHTDGRDLFLVQGPGRQRWQLSHQPDGPEHRLPDLPLQILADFQPEEEYILEEGDILYLPPGVVHHGVALEDCLTITIGCRAPVIAELAAAWCADTVSRIDTEHYYNDPAIELRPHPGLITAHELARVRETLRETLLRDDEEMARWFASFTTDVKPGHYLPEPEQDLDRETLLATLQQTGELWRSEYARFAYIEARGQTLLYVAGEEIPLHDTLVFAAPLLSGQRRFALATLRPHLDTVGFAELLVTLYNLGALYFPESD
ncbi:MAG: cupin domain-containing protein [Gammaproteobacteria bacterium]|nr:cupin domain-containing protein [Gammaproteobacteria bacterium]